MSSTTALSSSGSRHITVLGYLQDYADVSEQSHQELKSSFWHLTKSRRNVSSGILGVDSTTAFTAEMLREELRARIRLFDENDNKIEGDLVEEEDSVPPPVMKDDLKSSSHNSPPKWNLYDVLEKGRKDFTSEPSSMSSVRDADDDDDDPTLTTGLRQRKTTKEGNNEATTSSWTIVREEDLDSNSDDDDDDEKMLIRKDPIEFFYGHNRELKIAQRNAQNALAGYIQAANQAAALLTLLRETK
jgi:hypothetical protein